jgi:hypothetical protein
MTLGEGIFYSSLFLGVIALYIATKDRWRWKRIIFWPLGLVSLVAIGVGVFAYLSSLPTAQTEFWGVSLGEKKEDITFRKGAPQGEEGNVWVYTGESGSGGTEHTYKIRFEGNEVASVELWGPGAKRWSSPSLLGIRLGDSTADVSQRLGEPSKIAHDFDGMIRTYEYDEYNVCIVFVADEAKVYGIYGDDHGGGTVARTRSELVELEKAKVEAKKRARAHLEKLELEELRAKKARALRQGQQQEGGPWEKYRQGPHKE